MRRSFARFSRPETSNHTLFFVDFITITSGPRFSVHTGSGAFLSNGAKIRNLFVSPHAAERNFFYGVNFEFSYETPSFSQTHYGLEIRPIVGVRNSEWEFIVNPIVDIGLGALGEADFLPAARLAGYFESARRTRPALGQQQRQRQSAP